MKLDELITENLQNLNIEDEIEDDDAALDIPNSAKKILWQAKDFSIREFVSMKHDTELILQPDYQRNFVASNKISSRLIESILMDVPIPVIFLAEEQDGTLSVIDGQQRLTTFISFVEGKFPDNTPFKLSNLNVLSDLNRKTFNELSTENQKKIRSTTIHSIVIKKESNPDIKFEIFERLNTGSTKLNDNEIRNNLYRGTYNNLLKELSENETLHKLINNDNLAKRMGYRGLVLRFLAISEKSYLNYKGSMKQFLNKDLRDNQFLNTEKMKEYKERFEHCLDLVNIVFGSNSFRKYSFKEEEKVGSWAVGLNTALFDIQMCGFVNYTKNQILPKADLIREKILDLMINNSEFIACITNHTLNADTLKKRFKIYMNALEDIIDKPTPRFFNLGVKQSLFDKNPTCAISGQKILKIEDAEVDHIIPYSKGGKTELDNAQLVLRYFNRAKKADVGFTI